jgi:hypothetical protein
MKAEVINYFDVWGHGPSECHAYNCPCVVRTGADDDDEPETIEHDENRCECHHEINDMSKAGEVDIPDECDDAGLIALLVEAGYLKPHASEDTVEIEDGHNGSIEVNDRETGCPLYGLRYEV